MAEALDQPAPSTPATPPAATAPSDGTHAAAPASPLVPFPTEPFACPSCGQLLGPACRVCVACKQPIELARINAQAPATVASADFRPPPRTVVPTVPFPWGIFFLVLGLTWLVAGAALHFLGLEQAQLVFVVAQVFSSAWVFYDAREKGVPKPWRWAISALFVWLVIFPWYLARRRYRDAACPFMEAKVSPFFRALIFLVLILLVLGLVLASKNIPLPK